MMNSGRLEILLEQLKSDENDAFLNYAAAMEYMGANDSEMALFYLQKLHKIQPDYLPTYYQLASLLDDQDEVDEAIKILKEGVQLALKLNEQKAHDELSNYLQNLLME